MSTTFAGLGLPADLVTALSREGINEPFPIQALTIRDALAGRDICGKAKTGSGKTLAFGLPLLCRIGHANPGHPRALVLVPTRELANQVTTALRALGTASDRRVRAVYGGVSMDPQITALRKGADVVVGTPGRLIDLMERGELSVTEVEVLVIDEADRMADMGFMPQVQKVLYRMTQPHQTMLFSATLDGAVKRLVDRYMDDPVQHSSRKPSPRSRRWSTASSSSTRWTRSRSWHRSHEASSARSSSCARSAAPTGSSRSCEREGVRALAIHGDLRQGARERALADFIAGKVSVLVATDVAARGIHVDAVDVVVHYDPAEDHKAYLHRSGRTARAGESGVAVTLQLWNQENDTRVIQRRLGLQIPVVEVFSNDPRLADLANWDAAAVMAS